MRQWSNKHIGFTNIEMEILLLFLVGIESRVHKYRDGNSASVLVRYRAMLNALVKEPGKYRIAGDVFGPEDNYGIGLPKDSDGVEFVNGFLRKIEEQGLWTELWKISLGDRTGVSEAPDAPAVG